MGQRTNLLLQIEGRDGARLNKVYHLQWGYRRYLPMAFIHLVSARYFKPDGQDIFRFCTGAMELDGLADLGNDWNGYDFNKLEDCQQVLMHCDNNNGAMVVIVTEDKSVFVYPHYRIGFLLGPEGLQEENEPPFSHWVTTDEYMRHQPRNKELRDDIFAHAFDTLATLSGAKHIAWRDNGSSS
jgi:hypothetical protein